MNKIKIIFMVMFLPSVVLADDLYTSTIIGGCGDAYYYKAVLEPINYNCSNGQYLPAGATSCQSCPNTHTCNGGTFTFDANHTQGLSYGDVLVTDAIGSCSPEFAQNYGAVFEPITYVCNPGYYLPAGEDWINDYEGCRTCPANSYCVGGTYTFNETADQGITACPDNQTSLTGSSSVAQCRTFTLNWYIGNDVYDTTTCTINDTITLPTTPTRPGYVFTGWRIRTNND